MELISVHYKKKLIEVALPLEAINRETAREKSIRHGHPSTLHQWWSRKPLAAARAVLFASLVDDPSAHPELFPTEAEQELERQRLFSILTELIKRENINNVEIIRQAHAEIIKSTRGNLPPVYDPFCGGGSIPLEAQRLGLQAYASDLNPVAVLITRALITIPPLFADQPPVNQRALGDDTIQKKWSRAQGLADDVLYYGNWVREEAFKRIGHLYPNLKISNGSTHSDATVIAWLWCRTVRCPNPACGIETPLVSTFWLSTKKGKKTWIEPVVQHQRVEFVVKNGDGTPPDGTVSRFGARCICCDSPITFDYIRSESKAGRLGKRLMAIAAEGKRCRHYLPPNPEHEQAAAVKQPDGLPETNLCGKATVNVALYGIEKHIDLFTNRQLVALKTFSDLLVEVKERVYHDALAAGLLDDGLSISAGGRGASAYSEAVVTYLALAVNRLANRLSTLCVWHTLGEKVEQTFSRQALPMIWNFAEANVFSDSTGSWSGSLSWIPKVLVGLPATITAKVTKRSAVEKPDKPVQALISTDPPYYNNVGYADLSDFFYIWLRRSLRTIYPDLFSTMLVPKSEEIIYAPYRFDSDEEARAFFTHNLAKSFRNMLELAHPDYPITVYYAFRQSETDTQDDEQMVSSTGWETMLSGLIKAGLMITGTWPTRTEMRGGLRNHRQNALASSIVLVCRPRTTDSVTTRREFIHTLRKELSCALHRMQQGNIAPVDLAQAAIGPGMAVFSRYAKVLEADGRPMTVRTALQIINQELDAYLTAQEGELDAESRFCAAWYEQFGLQEAAYGEADVLAKAKNTSLARLEVYGLVSCSQGKVRLRKREELIEPSADTDSIWLLAQQLVRALESGGEIKAARMLQTIPVDVLENVKALVYRLYSIAERNGWTDEAYAYNSLIVTLPDIQKQFLGLRR